MEKVICSGRFAPKKKTREPIPKCNSIKLFVFGFGIDNPVLDIESLFLLHD